MLLTLKTSGDSVTEALCNAADLGAPAELGQTQRRARINEK